ncbi:MAG: TM2 domain-containing protein [Lachnospiraceae bacterium]|nr:TM2 domain-containing protein [Lachnospiraceae bacterium]
MVVEKDEASDKNELVAAVLALCWGTFGLHRFYVGKWISGTVYLLFGSVAFLFNLLDDLGLSVIYSSYISIIAFLLVVVAVLYDLFALKNESFFDGKNKLLISKGTREDSGLFLSPKEKAIASTNAWIIFFSFVLFVIVRYVIFPEVVVILAL